MSTGGGSATGAGGVFVPPGQPGVAAGLGQQIGPIAGQGLQALNTLGGNTPAGYAWPFVQGTTQNVLNNPYAGGAIGGGLDAASIFQNQILPETFSTSPSLMGLGSLAAGQGPTALGNTYGNPAYAQAGQVGGGLSPMYAGYAPQTLAAGFAPNAALTSGANSILATAFDPQQTLYNQLRQQQLDTSGATEAMSGVAGTPYGAGLTNQNLQNFDINWQNQQLGRQAAGLGAAGTAFGQGVSDIGAGATAGEGLGSSAISSLLGPANALTASTLEGTSALGNLTNTAGGAYAGSLGELGSLATGAPTLLSAPYNAFQGIQGNNFGALQNQIALGNQAYTQPQQTIADLLQYLGYGQQASGIANQIGTTNFNQLASGVGGAASLFGGGGPFGSQGAFGGGAGTGASAGFFGSQGPLFGTAADQSIAAGGPPLAAGGLPAILSPLAFAGS